MDKCRSAFGQKATTLSQETFTFAPNGSYIAGDIMSTKMVPQSAYVDHSMSLVLTNEVFASMMSAGAENEFVPSCSTAPAVKGSCPGNLLRQADNDFLSDYVQSESLRVRGPLWSHPDGFGGLASIFHYYVDYRSDSAVQDLADPSCKLEDKTEDGEAIDCKKRPDDSEELEDEAVHSCDSCLQVFESLSDITEHKIHQCQLT
ncbi:hypothetical protein STEG23_020358, partial [Scotinomys teguina]